MSKEREFLKKLRYASLLENDLRKELEELLAQPEREPSVKLPDSEDEAVMMNLLSDNWLRHHAPHRLNQPEQEPVAWMNDSGGCFLSDGNKYSENWTALYTEPKREPLSDEAIADLWWNNYVGTADSVRNFARAIEKAHGIGGG